MNLAHSLQLESEDSKDLANQTTGVRSIVSHKLSLVFKENIELLRRHGLHYESLIVAEEEEAPTSARSFAGHQQVWDIELRGQALEYSLRILKMTTEGIHKVLILMECHDSLVAQFLGNR